MKGGSSQTVHKKAIIFNNNVKKQLKKQLRRI